MTPALLLRHVPREGRPCHERKRARIDQDAVVRAVRDATGLPAHPVGRIPLEFTCDRNGLPIVSYSLSVGVVGRSWAGSGQAKDAELMLPANWRICGEA